LDLWLDACQTGFHLSAPSSHLKFLTPVEAPQASGFNAALVPPAKLVLQIHDEPWPTSTAWRPIFCSENWELWVDDENHCRFVAPRESPPVHLIVDPDFTHSDLYGEFSKYLPRPGYFISQNLEIILFVNWLARFSDIVLHASGVIIDDKGYCFAGRGGIGKSTLATALSRHASITVLGEDQVILRYLEGRFWIFGTPWHINPNLCNPHGAPLERLFFLERGEVQQVKALNPLEGTTRILQTAFIPYYLPAKLPGILDRLAILTEKIPLQTFQYNIGSDPLNLIHISQQNYSQ
jgi:hypothetical protein